jgi:cell division septation protein DedD
VAKKPPAKTDKKTTRVAIKRPQKRTNSQAANKPTIQKKTLIVKKPPQAAPSKAQPRTVKRSTKPPTTAKKPVIAQQRYRPATPTKKPFVVQQPSRPPAHEQRPVVVMKPSQPTPSTQKPVVAKKSPKPVTSAPRPVVAKKPQPVATLKPPPVVKEPVRPAAQSQKKPTLGKEELFPEETSLPYPYSVYLAAYKTSERAEKAISIYRNQGLSAYWVKVDLGDKGVWYRVFTGYFADQKQAEAFIKRKRIADGKAKRTKYAALIGIYATERDAQKKFLALSRLGYSPYVVETNSGESQLYVGAFYTKAGAEEQRSDLSSKGVQSRVVER